VARFSPLVLPVLVVFALLGSWSQRAAALESDEGPSIFEDRPETLVQERDEAEEDRIRAAALFAEGRLRFQREDFAGALRRYQRAWRSDPESMVILREIVDLALSRKMRRSAEGARYAVILAERAPLDPTFVRRVALHLTQQGETERAAALYEKSFELEKEKPIRGDGVLVRMEAGRLFLLAGDYEKAANHFELVTEALKKPDEFGLSDTMRESILDKADQTYAMFGEAFRMADRFDEAVAMFKKSHEAKADAALLELRLARVAEKKGDVEAAFTHLKKALAKNVETTSGQQYAVLSDLLKKKVKDEAETQKQLIERLEKLYAKNPKDALLAYYLADSYREAGNLKAAEPIYRKQLDEKPSLDGYEGLIDIYTRQEKVEELAGILGEALVAAGSLQQLDEVVDKLVADKELVDKYLNSVLKRGTEDAKQLVDGAALAAALIALKTDNVDLGVKLFELALKADKPDREQTVTTWGLQLFMEDKNEQAADVFRRGLDEGWLPDDKPESHFYLAWTSEMAGRTDEALTAAKKAAELDPDSPRFKSRVPWVLYHAKRYDEAEKQYLKLLKEFDSDHRTAGVREAMREARFVLSNICVHQDRIADAEEWLEQVLDEYPENIGAMNDLGYLWADEGKHLQRAYGMIQKAVEAEPDNVAYLDSLGWVLYRLGRYEDAVRELEKAAASDDPDGVILDHLGDAYLKANQKEKALETWRRAVEQLEADAEKRNEVERKIKEHFTE